jgi:hypothetical protein
MNLCIACLAKLRSHSLYFATIEVSYFNLDELIDLVLKINK